MDIAREDASSSKRIATVPPSIMFEIADKIRALQSKGEKVIDLSLGQPEVPAQAHISSALKKALDSPITSYTSAAGSIELRNLIAAKFSKESGVQTEASEVILTCGSKHALFISLLSIVDQGEEILVPEPYFPPYAEIAALIGAELRSVPVVESNGNGLKLDVESFLSSMTSKTKAVLLNYPNNPAGWTLEKREIEKVVEQCKSKGGVYLVSDEIYDKIVFDGREHTSAWTFSKGYDRIISLGSFSKTYSMVPFRLGYIVAHTKICNDILKSQRATITMVSPYVQSAGIAALSGPQNSISERLAKYEERRNRCVALLKSAGINLTPPQGAFYLFVKLPEKAGSGLAFANSLLENERVAVLPGEIFGERWSNYVRLSLATEDRALDEGITKFVEQCTSIL